MSKKDNKDSNKKVPVQDSADVPNMQKIPNAKSNDKKK
jgi:hypothetical protein